MAAAEDGVGCCELGRYGEGLPLLREAVVGMRRVRGEGHAETKWAVSALAQHEAVAQEEEGQAEETEEEKGVGGWLLPWSRLSHW